MPQGTKEKGHLKMIDFENMFMQAHLDGISMQEIEEYAKKLGADLSSLDFDSISLTPQSEDECFSISSDGEDCHDEYLNDFSNIIIVDNLPVVGPDKFGKLEAVILRIYNKIKVGMIKEDGFWMPLNPVTRETVGYCFIEFNTREEAELAKKKTDGYKLDKLHTFAVNLMEEFDRLINTPDKWTAPEPREKPQVCEEYLQYWLTDEKARDQFFVQVGCHVEVYWNDHRLLKPEFLHSLEILGCVEWSPLGTYLATEDKQGVILRGGAATFDPLIHCAHPQAQFDFSPGEKYLVTYSTDLTPSPNAKQRALLHIFHAKTGKIIRSFRENIDLLATSAPELHWTPIGLGGGKDDKHFARMEKNILHVYESESLVESDDCSLKVKEVQSFSWSPTDPVIAAFVPESRAQDQPARVIIIDVQSKEELRRKNLYNVNSCKMHWQGNGDYLSIEVDHRRRTANGTRSSFLIFWTKERGIPVDVLELENDDDKIIDFAWEPKGHRFAVVHGDNTRPEISFYIMNKMANTVKVLKLKTHSSKHANTLHWAPAGRFMVIAGLKDFDGKIEFYDTSEFKTLAMAEHYLATDIKWDPTGRYVATSVCCNNELENGLIIWSFFGKMLYQVQKDDLRQFSWRPRPPSVLSIEEEDKILKLLKEYSCKYEAEDRDKTAYLSEQDDRRRKMLMEEWQGWLMKWCVLQKEEKVLRQQIFGGDISDEEETFEAIEADYFEQVLDVKQVTFHY